MPTRKRPKPKPRADGRYQCSLTLPGGKRRLFYGRTLKEATDKREAVKRQLGLGIDVSKAQQPLGEYLEAWYRDTVVPLRSYNTQLAYRSHLNNALIPMLGHISLERLTPAHVQQALAQLRDAGRSASTIAAVKGVLAAALHQAVKWELLARNVASLVSAAPGPRRVVQITPVQARELLRATADHRLHALYVVMLGGGLRIGEACGLRWADLSADGELTIARQVQTRYDAQRRGYRVLVPVLKTEGSARRILLPQTVRLALDAHRKRQAAERLQAGPRWQEQGLMFPNLTGGIVDPRGVRDAFRLRARASGLPELVPHALRHMDATFALGAKISPHIVAEQLGHADIRTTLGLYGHVIRADQEELAAVMDRVLEGVLDPPTAPTAASTGRVGRRPLQRPNLRELGRSEAERSQQDVSSEREA